MGLSLPAVSVWGKRLHPVRDVLDFHTMMILKKLHAQPVASLSRTTVRGGLVTRLACLASVALLVPACRDKVSVPPTEVKAVEAYGVRLDESATPEQVTYVLLRSLRDDFEAAQAHDHVRQRQAFELTFSLAAFSTIEKQIHGAGSDGAGSRGGGPDETDAQKLYNVIYHWTPIVSHYVRSFDEDAAAMMARMKVFPVAGEPEQMRIYLDVAHDPANADPEARGPAVVDIRVAKEKSSAGSETYWRVARVGFVGPKTAEAAKKQSDEPGKVQE